MLLTEKSGLLIDAGLGTRTLKKHLKSYNLPFSQIKHMLITHDHADHVKSVGYISRCYHLPVYATDLVHGGINRNWSVRQKVEAEQVRVIEKGKTIELDDFTVTPFAVPHDSADNVGYCIVHDGMTFVHITDIGHLTDDIRQYIAKANYLVIEADYETEMLDRGPYPEHLKSRIRGPFGHFSNADCAQAIAENATPALRHVWLCHLSDENNHPDLAEKSVKHILHTHGIVAGNEPGADFYLDVLKRKTPSRVFTLGRDGDMPSGMLF